MKLEKNKLVRLAKKGQGEDLAFITEIEFDRNTYGRNYISIRYSEVYGIFETSAFFEDIDYMVEVDMTEKVRRRLIEKWGEDVCKERGILL